MPLKLFRTTGFAQDSRFAPQRQRQAAHPLWAVFLASLWMASACNAALWRTLFALPGMDDARGLGFALGFAVVIAAACSALLSLLAWRWILKPAIAVFLLAAAAGAYFMLAYGIVIDTPMIANTLQTDPREVRDLLGWKLLATLAVLGLLPCLLLWRAQLRHLPLARRMLHNAMAFFASMVVLVVVSMAIFQDLSSVMRNNPQLRYLVNPLNTFYALGDLAAKPFARDTRTRLPLGEDARLGASYAAPAGKPPLLLLVLGETARAANFSLNGYERPTNPELAAEKVASFRKATSCGTSTAASVPCMFSHLGRKDFDDRKAEYDNLLDVLQRAGLAVLWLDNQAGCKGVCERVANVSTAALRDPKLCADGECFDEIMLQGLDERIAALPAERRAKGVVLVMHQMGSHGPAYYKRVPPAFRRFQPECRSNALQDCAREEVRNAYDNTIAYTDHFLASAVRWLKAREARAATAMLYVSDHGESLGENNLYLHGLPYAIAPEVQKHVPWIVWLSPAFERRGRATMACLARSLDKPVSHDHYFHSVLSLMDVETQALRPALDMFADCRR